MGENTSQILGHIPWSYRNLSRSEFIGKEFKWVAHSNVYKGHYYSLFNPSSILSIYRLSLLNRITPLRGWLALVLCV